VAKSASGSGIAVQRVVVIIGLLVVAGLFAGVARQSWSATTDAADIVELETEGAEMLHPMVTLLTELVTAQSAAVRGQPVDQTTVRAALSSLFQPDAAYGAQLQTSQRLRDLAAQVETAFAAGETGEAAYATYSSLVDLAVALIRVIGDTSRLVHDQNLDSYYLMDAAIIRLPNAMVYAGRAADLVTLAGGEQLVGEDLVRAAVARFNVSFDAEQVELGLKTSIDYTERSELGTNITQRLDTFQAAADEFAPPTMLRELATDVDAVNMAANASRVFAAAASLSHLLLSELEALLDIRAVDVAEQRRFTVIATSAAGVLGLALVWLLLVGRPGRPSPRRSPDEPTTGARGFSAGWEGVGRVTGRVPVAGRGGPGELAGSGLRRGGHAR
jgi:hypothetical protein